VKTSSIVESQANAFIAQVLTQPLPPIVVVPVEVPDNIQRPMTVDHVDVDIRIHGFVADTTMTLVFGNPNERVLAGDFYFPLPEGATVSGYALDVEGRMVDGVPVEKEKARVVFEKALREGIDPGLVEYTKGNVFKTRVFPIPARGSRTIRVRFLSELIQNERAALYQLPFNFQENIPEFHLRVAVVHGKTQPEICSDLWKDLQFGAQHDSLVAEVTRRNETMREGLLITLPDVERRRIAVERNDNGHNYFTIFDDPPKDISEEAIIPKGTTIYWDVSASRAGCHDREIQLLKSWFSQFKTGDIQVRLMIFCDTLDKLRSFTVKKGNAESLLKAIAALDYDGGTRLALVPPQNGDAAADADLYFLFSDGLNTLGDEQFSEGFAQPLYIVSDAMTAAHPTLRFLAAQSGGEYFNLTRMGIEDVLPRMGRAGLTLLGVDCDCTEARNVVPGLPIPAHGRVGITGELAGKEAKITLRYGIRGKATATRTYQVREDDAFPGDVLRPYWAQRRLDEWLIQPEQHRATIRELGRAHGLVTPETSLMVLENIDQYVRHEIRPPASWPGLREDYDTRLAQKARAKMRRQEDRIERVLALWRKRVQWWKKSYTYEPGFKYMGPTRPKRRIRDSFRAFSFPFFKLDLDYPSWLRERKEPVESEVPPESISEPTSEQPGEWDDARGFELDTPTFCRPGITPAESGALLKRAVVHETESGPYIQIEPWDPETPYLAAIEKAESGQRYAVYLQQREEYGRAPAFYLDCSDFFMRRNNTKRALRILSNIAELALENAFLLRVLAHRLRQWGRFDDSIAVFEEVRNLRGEEPQSHRDLALVLADRAQTRLDIREDNPAGREDLRRAIELLYHVVMNRWDRSREIELTALIELNRLLTMAKRLGITHAEVDGRLVLPMDLDVRIAMTWDADLTDVDLWVTEPSGEKCMYSHKHTTIGGLLSRDFTDGYGPEEYLLRRAMEGTYCIEANYFESRAPLLTGPVTVQVDVFTNYARSNEKRQSLTFRLGKHQDIYKVGEIQLPKKPYGHVQ